MQFQYILALSAAIVGVVVAENDVTASDVPSACLPACQFTIDLSASCERTTDGDDQYRPCVCGAQDSMRRLTECASCVKDHGMSDPDDNDVADLMDDCGWDFNDASGPYPTEGSGSNNGGNGSGTTTVTVIPSSTTTNGGTSTVTVIQTPSASSTSTSNAGGAGPTVTVTQSTSPSSTPSTTPDAGSMAGALDAKSAVFPLVAGLLLAGIPAILL